MWSLDFSVTRHRSVSDVSSTVTTIADSTIHALGDAVGNVTSLAASSIGDAASNVVPTVEHLADATLHTVGDMIGDLGSAAVTAAGNAIGQIDDVAGATSGVHDLIGSTLGSLGVSSSGSLSFAGDAPDTMASHDIVGSASGYSQFNLAVSDASHDASLSSSESTDTGGITTIIASAIGIGHTRPNSTSETIPDHGGDHQPVHLPVLDDLHSHLHVGLFG